MTTAARSCYEIVVRTRVSPAALARLRLTLAPTAVPRRMVYRLRIPADRDITEVVERLTVRGIQLLEVRKTPGRAATRHPATGAGAAPEQPCADVIAPFRTVAGPAPEAPPSGGRGDCGWCSGSQGSWAPHSGATAAQPSVHRRSRRASRNTHSTA
jgi:hypothetical protein